jgi:hypothetical protein
MLRQIRTSWVDSEIAAAACSGWCQATISVTPRKIGSSPLCVNRDPAWPVRRTRSVQQEDHHALNHEAWRRATLFCLLWPSAPFRRARTQSRCLAIRVMQTAQHQEGNDLRPTIHRTSCCRPRFRNMLVDALVRARAIEIRHVLGEDTPQVRFAEDQHMVEAFTPDAPHQAFADRIRAGCLDRRSEHLDATADRHCTEVCAILGVIVSDQKPRRISKRRGLAQLLRDPGVCWRAGDADMHNAPRAKRGDDEREQRAEQSIVELEEIAGLDLAGVVLEKRGPVLAMRSQRPHLTNVARNRPLGHREVQFQQLTLDPLDAPQVVVARHLLD